MEVIIRNKCTNQEAKAGFRVTWVACGSALGWVWVLPGGSLQVAQRPEGGCTQTQTHWDTPDLLPVPSAPCWALPTASHPCQPCSISWGVCWVGTLAALGSFLPETRATSVHIPAKRDSPNLRPPQHCLHKSCAYFCIKSSSFQSYSNARNKRLLWLHVMLKDRWRRAQCLCWIQMSAEIIPVIPNWCCICL